MIVFLVVFGIGAGLLPVLAKFTHRWVFVWAALIPTAAFAHALAAVPALADGEVRTETVPWVPGLGLELAFRMDALSGIMALLVAGVGALVFLYCFRYFAADDRGTPRFVGVLMAFAGSMYGLVLADDVLLFVIFWEATSVFSYLLIGQLYDRRASRGAALQALLVTTLGGLVMLIGLLLLAAAGGTTSISGLLEQPPTGGVVPVAIVLVIVGAVTKSAILPFHFWLPAAMAAPTPVSAYLHAAAMVKAGIYLVLRFAPGFAQVPGWRETLLTLGLATMIFGAVVALRQVDLKLLLAYGTVSQLGFLIAVAAYGTAAVEVAAVALLVSHALFKACLFLVAGAIDHDCGTRDIRRLSGVGRRRPWLFAVAALAVLSMAGLPPALGFVAKEAAFTALLDDALAGSLAGWVTLVVVALGSAVTLAYGVRFLWGGFARKPGVDDIPLEPASALDRGVLGAPPALLALAGLVFGPLVGLLDPIVVRTADALPGAEEVEHLALWHGFEPALLITAAGAVVGALVARFFGLRLPAEETTTTFAARAYAATVTVLDRLANLLTSATQRGSLPFYLGVVFVVVIASTAVSLTAARDWFSSAVLIQTPVQPVAAVLMIVAAIAAARATKRFQAAVLVGVTGVGMAALFATQGAPDLALTQVLIEVITLLAIVLVLRRLPARLGERHGSRHRIKRSLAGIGVGLTFAAVAFVATSARVDPPASVDWPRLAQEIGHGANAVNVALVDIRGWDTMGELSVMIAAATGVASLIFVSSRADVLPRVPRRRARATLRAQRRQQAEPMHAPAGRGAWLLAGRTLAPHYRSILLEVVVRLIFHALIVVSIYLLLAGHNAPGGGFAGGLVAGLALCARYLAGGRHELGAAAPFDAGKVLGAGLLFATVTALAPLVFGADALTSTWFEIDLGVLGTFEFVTSTLFDVGVYLVVVGLTLDILRSLGAEVDRQAEEDLPEVTP